MNALFIEGQDGVNVMCHYLDLDKRRLSVRVRSVPHRREPDSELDSDWPVKLILLTSRRQREQGAWWLPQ